MFCNHDEMGAIAPLRLSSDYRGDYDPKEEIPGLPFTTRMTINKMINFFMPQFLCLQNGRAVGNLLRFGVTIQ